MNELVPIRVLIAEDEYLIAAELGYQLRHRGIEVVGFVGSAPDAVIAAERTQPDLILMDIDLRGQPDGVHAAREILSRFGIPSVFTSANDHQREQDRIAAACPIGWIAKPYDYDEIQRLLVEWVAELRHFRDEPQAPERRPDWFHAAPPH